ncbi:hypothetical protein [Mycobacteroides abscessus]|uniref:hypothetical protein n=1 Tax=Mycobacteroides abscessus TaxID=36809 RepID=UPI0010570D90|nr:hypothetical protein [Mycobacteroides abscessus]
MEVEEYERPMAPAVFADRWNQVAKIASSVLGNVDPHDLAAGLSGLVNMYETLDYLTDRVSAYLRRIDVSDQLRAEYGKQMHRLANDLLAEVQCVSARKISWRAAQLESRLNRSLAEK